MLRITIAFAVLIYAAANLLAQSVDLQIGHFEITQGLQDGFNTIPLVLGKPTVVRAFPVIATGGGTVTGVDARLRAFRSGSELPHSPVASDNGPIAADGEATRLSPNDSLNFTLEPDWYENDTELRVELVLPEGVLDPELANNTFPPGDAPRFMANYHDHGAYAIRFLRVHYTHPSWMGLPRPSDRVLDQAACDYLRSVSPVDPDEMTYAEFTPGEVTFNVGSSSGALDGDALITELNSLWAGSDPADRPDRLYAWTPANSFASNGLSDPLWAGGQNRVCFGNDTDGRWRRTFAHEIGHNTDAGGLFHVSRRLQNEEYGFDVTRVDPFDRIVMRKYPPEDLNPTLDLFDIMRGGEIESHAWICPEHYRYLFDHFSRADAPSTAGPATPISDDAEPAADGESPAGGDDVVRPIQRELLVVRGRVTREGGGRFFPFYRVPAAPDVEIDLPTDGTHEVRFVAQGGEVLKRIRWTPDFRTGDTTDELLDSRSFTWFVEPFKNVVSVELLGRDKPLDTIKVRTEGPQIANLERAAIETTDNGNVYRLTWEATAPPSPADDGEEPKLIHQVYYSNNAGQTWQIVATGLEKPVSTIRADTLPGGEKCLFQIRTTDGYNVDVKTGEPFVLEKKAPKATIIAPRSERSYREGAGVLLIGQGYDLEEHVLPDKQLAWKSDIQGELGTGRKLVVRNLKRGTHKITLTATDSQNDAGVSESIEVIMKGRDE